MVELLLARLVQTEHWGPVAVVLAVVLAVVVAPVFVAAAAAVAVVFVFAVFLQMIFLSL